MLWFSYRKIGIYAVEQFYGRFLSSNISIAIITNLLYYVAIEVDVLIFETRLVDAGDCCRLFDDVQAVGNILLKKDKPFGIEKL